MVHARTAVIAAAAVLVLAGCTSQQSATTTTSATSTTTAVRSTTTVQSTTTTTTTDASLDNQIADAAKQYLLAGWFLQPPDGDFKNINCRDPATCWAPYVDSITFSDGVLYLHMDTDWTYQPDAERMLMAQERVAAVLHLGPGPAIVMDNVRFVQAMDLSGEIRSKVPLKP
jgi:thiamine biosynthesis lipoprotein ApbE